MNLTRDFTADFEAIAGSLNPEYIGPPIALSRFGDGEYAILRNMVHIAKSDGWRWDGQRHELQQLLLLSLTAGCEFDNYYAGISAENHHPRANVWYREQLHVYGVPLDQTTFASLFIFANYERFQSIIGDLSRFVTVGGHERCDFHTPVDPADDSWPNVFTDIARELLKIDYTDAILVSAGPWSSILVHRYWQLTEDCRDRRHTILDVGSAIDERLRGRKTRQYQHKNNPQRNWVPKWHIEQSTAR